MTNIMPHIGWLLVVFFFGATTQDDVFKNLFKLHIAIGNGASPHCKNIQKSGKPHQEKHMAGTSRW